jgi:hypothetical protein
MIAIRKCRFGGLQRDRLERIRNDEMNERERERERTQ